VNRLVMVSFSDIITAKLHCPLCVPDLVVAVVVMFLLLLKFDARMQNSGVTQFNTLVPKSRPGPKN